MLNPFVLQMLARMRMQQQQPFGSTAMDFPVGNYGMQPWDMEAPPATVPSPVFDREAAERDARRQGLGALGIALLKGAPTGDFAGSLAEGLAGMAETRHRLMQEAEQEDRQRRQDELARDSYERQVRLTDAQIRNFEEDNERARQTLEAKTEAERAEIVKQQQVVAGLPPEQRARLAPLIGTDSFYRDYWEATKPEEPEKPYRTQVGRSLIEIGPDGKPNVLYTAPADPSGGGERIPTTRQFADGTTRQWNPEARSWDVMAKAGPTEEQLQDDIAAETDRRYRAWLTERMKGVGEPVSIEKAMELQKRGVKGFPVKVGPSERKLKVKMRDGSVRIMTEDQYKRWEFRVQAEAEVRRRKSAAQSLRGNQIMDFDENGNPL